MKLTKENTNAIQRIAITIATILAVCAGVSLGVALFELAPKVILGLFFGGCIFILVHSWLWDEKLEEDDAGYY